MKKSIVSLILILFALCLPLNFGSENVFAINTPNSVTVIANTYIYKDHDIKSEMFTKIVGSGESQTEEYVVLKTGTVLNVDNSSPEDYKLFYTVFIFGIIDGATETDVGYVLKAHTLDSSISSPEKRLDTNATIKNDNVILYTYDQITKTYKNTDITLKSNTGVRILDGYDKKKEYTYISYQNDDGEILSYYIKTSDLSVKGVNYSVIIAISTLVTCVAILGIVFGIWGKKKKKKNK